MAVFRTVQGDSAVTVSDEPGRLRMRIMTRYGESPEVAMDRADADRFVRALREPSGGMVEAEADGSMGGRYRVTLESAPTQLMIADWNEANQWRASIDDPSGLIGTLSCRQGVGA